MVSTHPEGLSYWIASTPDTGFPPLAGDATVDVAVIGGGIVGVTAATLLKRAGQTVALIEARRIAGQVTGYTTAKITSQHGLIYADLIRKHGEDTARIYGEANQAALNRIVEFVQDEGIACDFSRKAAFAYTETSDAVDRIREEVEAAVRLGLPARFVTQTPLPFSIAGAARFDDQAQFHPRKYLLALVRGVPGAGSHVHENTRVLDVEDGTPCRVHTDRGVVTAREVIVATNLPILDRGGYFTTAFPRSHVVIAARLQAGTEPDGMFISIDQPTRSLRVTPDPQGSVLILSGSGFKTGQADTAALMAELEDWMRARFPGAAVLHRWTNEDYDSADRLPYIGRLHSGGRHIWVATGFGAWGMTNGTLAAMLLSDLVQGRDNAWAKTFDSTRWNPSASAGAFIRENLNVGREWIGGHLHRDPKTAPSDLAPGQAAILQGEKGKIAAYRDEQGRLYTVSAACTHLGCIVAWNAVARTWDCPCHGSRYSYDGEVLCGPTVKPLERVRLNPEAGGDRP